MKINEMEEFSHMNEDTNINDMNESKKINILESNHTTEMQDINDMEEDVKFKIIKIEDENKNQNEVKEVCNECLNKVQDLYHDFYIWVKENQNNPQLQERKEKLIQESEKLFNSAKKQIQQLKENEDLKKVVEKGIRCATETGNWIMDRVNDGMSEVMKSDSAQKVKAMLHQAKEDERIKHGVSSFKKGAMNVVDCAYNNLKKVLDTSEQNHETEVESDEANNNL